jgi:hypothetical protein
VVCAKVQIWDLPSHESPDCNTHYSALLFETAGCINSIPLNVEEVVAGVLDVLNGMAASTAETVKQIPAQAWWKNPSSRSTSTQPLLHIVPHGQNVFHYLHARKRIIQ